ncbi:hypothetical protein SH1V18_10840 [Vallitalea longa]|uniref:Lipoprotein n=1 Tax=Vallitalea longa TaxID=2936439 RepID=A0A9W5Y8R5_9FIRM|nr:hypothetical protein [Vallitalea longa]GKX28604.1 hypothetical protein SH1V18_10840 [Vallitalea longa]
MKKVFITLLSIIILATGCYNTTTTKLNEKNAEVEKSNTDVLETRKYDIEEINNTHEKAIEEVEIKNTNNESEKDDTTNEIENNWFSGITFKKLDDLIGKQMNTNNDTVSIDELNRLFVDSTNYCEWELLAKNNKLYEYQFEAIDYYGKEPGNKEIHYIDLNEYFSNDILYSTISIEGPSILMDYKKNTICLLDNEYGNKSIEIAYEISKDHQLRDLNFIGGYKEEDRYIILFEKDNTIYSIDIESFEVIDSGNLEGFRYISGYVERDYEDNTEEFYYYVTDKKQSILKKICLSNNKQIYDSDIINKIKGEIIKVEVDSDIIFILTNDNGIYNIYQTNEDLFHYLDRKEFEHNVRIDDIREYNQNSQNMYLILYDKQSEIPVKKIEAYGLDWESVI